MNKEVKILLGIFGAVAIMLGAGIFLLSISKPQEATVTAANPEVLGSSDKLVDGKLELVEFGDFQCPSCAAAHPILNQLIKDYNGKVVLKFRHMPLPIHPNARIAAEASEAAKAQGKFWEMHDILYEHQKEWSESPSPLNIFVAYAKVLGLNPDQFQSDVSSHKYADVVEKDYRDGTSLKVLGTPTFYVLGQPFMGMPDSRLRDAIDKALTGK